MVSPGSLQRYREAHVALAGGEYARARTLLDELPPEFLLADYAAFFAAEAVLRGGDETLAVTRFRAFIERFPDSLLWPQAQLAIARHRLPAGPVGGGRARGPALPGARAGPPGGGPGPGPAGRGARRPGTGGRGDRRPPAPLDRGAGVRVGRGGAGEPGGPGARRRALRGAARPSRSSSSRPSVWRTRASRARRSGSSRASWPRGRSCAVRHRALARLAPMLGRLARSDEAIARLDAALTEPVTPSRAALLYELGRLLQRSGQTGRGAAMYERLLAEHPDAPNLAEATLQLARARAELGQFDAAREAFQAGGGAVSRQRGGRVGALGGGLARVPRRPAPRGRPRLPPALDHGRERAAGRALLGGPLARPAGGERGGAGALSRGAEPRPAGLLRHPRRAPRAGEAAAPGRPAREAHGGSGRPAPARGALPAGAGARLDRLRRVRHPGARGARPGRGRGQRSRLGARGRLRRSRGGRAEPPLPPPGARPGRGSGGAGAPAAPLAALLSPRVRRARPRRGPRGGARPVRRRGRDPRGVLLRPARPLRRRGDRPDAAHARHRAPGRAGARPPPRGRSPPSGSRP